jgi:hypothetical protein
MKLELAILSYDASAVFDDYDDGSHVAFDAIEAEVLSGERKGEKLRILVEGDSPAAKHWNRPGQKLTVLIEPEHLTAQVLFAGAFTIEAEP